MAKNQAKAKQYREAEHLLFENGTLSSFLLSSKTNMRYSKKCAQNRCVNEIGRFVMMKMGLKIRNGSPRYNINRVTS